PGGTRALAETADGFERAGNADADRAATTRLCFQPVDHLLDHADTAEIIMTWRVLAQAQKLASIRLHGHALDLCSTPVDTDKHANPPDTRETGAPFIVCRCSCPQGAPAPYG